MNAHPTSPFELTTFDALRLPAMSPDLAQAIAEHLSAVLVDEAQFDDAGKCLDEKEAARTLRDEFARFREFCELPCQTLSDVQAKISYVLTGTQGDRTPLSEYIYVYDGNELQILFLESLLCGGAR